MNKTHHHMKESLRILCARDGGRHAVAAAIGCNEQTLYQVLRGVKTPKGLEREDAKRDGHTPPIYVPLLENAASMGIGSEVLPVDVVSGRIPISHDWALQNLQQANAGALRFIHGLGDSMMPTFADGDILLVDTSQRDAGSIDGVYVLRAYDRMYIKRVRRTISGVLEVSSDNPAVKTVDVLDGTHQVDVLGRVIWVWNGKKV